jgi:hypothetical protein
MFSIRLYFDTMERKTTKTKRTKPVSTGFMIVGPFPFFLSGLMNTGKVFYNSGATTFSITTHSIMDLIGTLRISDSLQNDTQHKN